MAINALDPNVRFAKRRVRLSLLYQNYKYVAEQLIRWNTRGIKVLAAAAESWAGDLEDGVELIFKNPGGDEILMVVGEIDREDLLKMIVSVEIVEVTTEGG